MALNVSGNLGVGGVLTYEDVTNVDSVGVITARSGSPRLDQLLVLLSYDSILHDGARFSGILTASSLSLDCKDWY